MSQQLNSTQVNDLINIQRKAPHEGAGFILTYRGKVVLSVRRKTAKQLADDSTPEWDLPGGKNLAFELIALQTAFRELIEELGGNPLNPDFAYRAVAMNTWQPISLKWIVSFRLELEDDEFAELCKLAAALDSWDPETTKDFSALTGNKEECRKSLDKVCLASFEDLNGYVARFVDAFKDTPGNRMKQGKEYRKMDKIKAVSVLNPDEVIELPLRGYYAVVLQDKVIE